MIVTIVTGFCDESSWHLTVVTVVIIIFRKWREESEMCLKRLQDRIFPYSVLYLKGWKIASRRCSIGRAVGGTIYSSCRRTIPCCQAMEENATHPCRKAGMGSIFLTYLRASATSQATQTDRASIMPRNRARAAAI